MNEPAICSQVFDDGSGPALYVGGWFTAAGGASAPFIAKWDGSAWSSLGSGLGPSQAFAVAMVVYDDGTGPALFVGGNFTTAGGLPAQHIAKWDGSSWSALGSGVGPQSNNSVQALAVHDDGSGPQLYAGGEFMIAGGISARNIARWNGTTWSAVGGGLYNQSGLDGASGSASLLPFADGSGSTKLIAGGHFNRAGGVPVKHIAMWNGTSWSDFGGGVTNTFGVSVLALATPPDSVGILYVGGLFDAAGGVTALSIARWDSSGWSALGDGGISTSGVPQFVYALRFYDDGTRPSLFVGGNFTEAGGNPALNIAKWDGTNWSALGGGAGASTSTTVVYDLAVFDDLSGSGPDLIPVGWFDVVDGSLPASHLARWNGCPGPGILYCPGDAPSLGCPCANPGAGDHGCENSAATGGALLSSSGSIQPDTVVLHASGELPAALSVFLQGDANVAPTAFGDGLRCIGGQLKRLYVESATTGATSAPNAGDPAISARSAELGDVIAPGSARFYQVYYRDPDLAYCPAPQGDSWNVSNALLVLW